MVDPTPTALLWSGGKDATLALAALDKGDDYTVDALVTTVVEGVEVVTMHGVPLDLIRAQAEVLDRPLHVMRVPPAPSNATYEEQLERTLAPLLAQGVTTIATGDLFLDDIRTYRERTLRRIGAKALFPLWYRDTEELAQRVTDMGVQAIVSSVDTTHLDASFVGRAYDTTFIRDLPDSVDPCGEEGAFHTFVTDAPPFACAVPVRVVAQHGQGRMRYAQLEHAPR
jgi:uncharacterized protein (TIGR00290 family)